MRAGEGGRGTLLFSMKAFFSYGAKGSPSNCGERAFRFTAFNSMIVSLRAPEGAVPERVRE